MKINNYGPDDDYYHNHMLSARVLYQIETLRSGCSLVMATNAGKKWENDKYYKFGVGLLDLQFFDEHFSPGNEAAAIRRVAVAAVTNYHPDTLRTNRLTSEQRQTINWLTLTETDWRTRSLCSWWYCGSGHSVRVRACGPLKTVNRNKVAQNCRQKNSQATKFTNIVSFY